MAKYSSVLYGNAIYGESPRLGYSVEPMTLEVDNFTSTTIYWNSPSGNFSKIRVLRNQSGYSETAEDGVIIFEQASADGSSLEGLILTNYFRDGIDNPSQLTLVSGREVYYRVFLYTDEHVWVTAGSINGIIPRDTGATKKMVDLLPRVLTSQELSPLGVVDETSDLYRFLDGLAFTYELMLTSIELIRPSHSRDNSTYSSIPGEDLHVGLDIQPSLPVVNQRRLIREALYLYSKRGTKVGLEGYAEALTGYVPTATISTNTLLTVQDSTFYKTLGNWAFTNATAVASTDETAATGTNVIDTTYSCKVTASAAFYMELGVSDPIKQGSPVLLDTEYTASAQIKSPPSDGNVYITILWYDGKGAEISSDTGTPVAANNTWQTVSVTATSPVTAVYSAISIDSDADGQYYVDQVCIQPGPDVEYDEARAITLLLGPRKENYITNPSFEVDASGWTLTGVSFSQDASVPVDGYPGTHSGKFVAASAWSITDTAHLPLESGIYFTFSMYCKSPALTTMDMYAKIYNSSDVLLETFHESHPITSDWMRHSITGLIGTTTAASYAIVSFGGAAGTIYLDMIQAEDTTAPTDYFDGSMPSSVGAVWSGTANASSSLFYPSKPMKIKRLAHTMVDWVPMNSFWRITTPAGVEYNNLQV